MFLIKTTSNVIWHFCPTFSSKLIFDVILSILSSYFNGKLETTSDLLLKINNEISIKISKIEIGILFLFFL